MGRGRPVVYDCEIGDIYGKWTVAGLHGRDAQGIKKWNCVCECGTHKIIRNYTLQKRNIRCYECSLPRGVVDETGNVYDRLKVISYNRDTRKWKCVCECGDYVFSTGGDLRSKYRNESRGTNRSCKKCANVRLVNDIVGKVYGGWTVIAREGNDKSGNVMFRCRCECGTESVIASGSLTSGTSKRCKYCGPILSGSYVDLLPGKRHRNWKILERTEDHKFRCLCDCGYETVMNRSFLVNGHSYNCKNCQKAKIFNEMLGRKYDGWLVAGLSNKGSGSRMMLVCICDCGNVRRVSANSLREQKSKMCRSCSVSLRSGENSPSWKGGKSEDKYPRSFYKIRPFILKRDKHRCKSLHCRNRKQDPDQVIDVHHIDHNPKNSDPSNLISLCHNVCHPEEQRNLEHYMKIYRSMALAMSDENEKIRELVK